MNKVELNAFTLKIIALLSMTIDHIGYFLYPQYTILRIIGRIAFVIFAYFSANAYFYTRNKELYFVRLLVFGLLIDLVAYLTNNYYVSNIFITLSLGFLSIYAFDKKKYYLLLVLLVPMVLNIEYDYGFYGVALVFASYYLRSKIGFLLIVNAFLVMVFDLSNIQLYSSIGLLLLMFYNNEQGPKMKYFFYLYYPIHIIIINLIAIKFI